MQPLRPLYKVQSSGGSLAETPTSSHFPEKPFTSQPHLEQHGQTAVALRLPPGVEASQAQSTEPSPPYSSVIRSTTVRSPTPLCPTLVQQQEEAPWEIITNDKTNNPNKARTARWNFHTDSYLAPRGSQGRSEAHPRLLSTRYSVFAGKPPPIHLEKKKLCLPGGSPNEKKRD